MKFKKLILLGTSLMFATSAAFAQMCQITGSANYNTTSTCSTNNITVSGNSTLKKMDSEGQYVPCGGTVSVQLQKHNGTTWANIGSPVTGGTTYGINIPSSYGSGSYRVYITNPGSSCGCSTATSWVSNGTTLSFNSNLHDNSYSFNGTSTFNTGCADFMFCEGQQINMDNIVMTYPSSNNSVNKWRISTANDLWFTNHTWTSWTLGVPPSSYDLLSLLQTNYGTALPAGQYGIQLETYNGCTTVTHFACLNVLSMPIFSLGQKYDATNFNTIPTGKNNCLAPYTNICPSETAPYSYIITGQNTSIAPGQLNNCTWNCKLEEYPLDCVGTGTLVFSKPAVTLTSMNDVSNMDLNAYSTTHGGKPVNYVQTYGGTKKWKFTFNIQYSCGTTYSYTRWLAYNVTGCRIGVINEEGVKGSNALSENALSVFPNPTTSSVDIKTNETIRSIAMYDITGKEMKVKVENNNVDLSNFDSGIYTLKVYTENGVSLKKIIKQD